MILGITAFSFFLLTSIGIFLLQGLLTPEVYKKWLGKFLLFLRLLEQMPSYLAKKMEHSRREATHIVNDPYSFDKIKT